MAKQHDSHRIYRALLYLYPRSHQEIYSQQMVQTLDDMLSDQRTAFDRFAVWLRVGFELPFNIFEENINARGEISMNKLTRITDKQYVYGALAILVCSSYLLIGLVWRNQNTQITSLNSNLQNVSKNQFATNGGPYYDPTVIPSEAAVYFPLAKLKFPATDLNQKLVYTYVTDPQAKERTQQLNISTHDLAINNYSSKQFNCSDVVYADFATSSYPINPQWKSNGSVKLADGRTMNIYYAPNIPGCDQAWKMSKIDSKAIADSLKQAVSY